jgi:hypothetical protein
MNSFGVVTLFIVIFAFVLWADFKFHKDDDDDDYFNGLGR